ncbi:MAG: hypothetical protein ABSE15_01825 [Candidatus Bathyarchaeia archaeon]
MDQNFLTTKESEKTSYDKLLSRLMAKPLGLISLGAEEWLQQFAIKGSGVTENEYEYF